MSPTIFLPRVVSRIGGRIAQFSTGIDLAKTSLRMFLEEGLDPLQSVFNLQLTDPSAFLAPNAKAELGCTRSRSLRATEGHQS